ncbi:MAG: class I SAM-dependent methyltransferase [Thermodesulfobacteriota bacterium]
MRLNENFQKALGLLTCPACAKNTAADLTLVEEPSPALQCTVCRTGYPVVDGVIDFLPSYEENRQPGLAQRLMENRAVVAFYERYFRPAFTRMGSPITYDEEMAWLKKIKTEIPVRTVLDLACGTGKYARLLDDMYRPEFVFAADISLPMLRQARTCAAAESRENMIHLRADAGALPFKKGVLDRVNCFGALHLFPDVPRTLMELGRTAVDKAVFTCLTSRKVKGLSLIQSFFSRLATFQFFDENRLEKDLKEAGFSDMRRTCNKMVLAFSCVKTRPNFIQERSVSL